jgi:hypothetical protein
MVRKPQSWSKTTFERKQIIPPDARKSHTLPDKICHAT